MTPPFFRCWSLATARVGRCNVAHKATRLGALSERADEPMAVALQRSESSLRPIPHEGGDTAWQRKAPRRAERRRAARSGKTPEPNSELRTQNSEVETRSEFLFWVPPDLSFSSPLPTHVRSTPAGAGSRHSAGSGRRPPSRCRRVRRPCSAHRGAAAGSG